MELVVGEYRDVSGGGMEPGSLARARCGVELCVAPGVKRCLVGCKALCSEHVGEEFLAVAWYFVRGFGLEYGLPERGVDVVDQVG